MSMTIAAAIVPTVLVAATDDGVARVGFESEGFEQLLRELEQRLPSRSIGADAIVLEVRSQLDEYFAGRRTAFTVPLDRRLSHGFRLQVLQAMSGIPYGQTRTYTGLAAVVGRPTAARAAGRACATNPVAIIVPCHRVLRSDGTLGGYGGGLPAKRTLLALEAAAAPAPSARSNAGTDHALPAVSRAASLA